MTELRRERCHTLVRLSSLVYSIIHVLSSSDRVTYDMGLSGPLCVQTTLNLVNVLERALQVLSRSQPHVKAAKQITPGPASHSEAEGVLSSTLLLVLAVRRP